MISVIVPIYNAANYLQKCLESLSSQDIDSYEVLLVDDGSVDDSAAICRSYVSKYTHFRYFNKENGGVSSARNYGIEKARGDYIVFVDSDDYVDKDYLSIMFQLACTTNAEIVIQGLIQHRKDESNKYEQFPDIISDTYKMDRKLFFKLIMFRGPYCKLFRTDIIQNNNIIFPENISYGEDALFYYQYLLNCNTIAFSSSLGYNYIVKQNGSLSTKIHHPEKLYFFYRERTRLVRHLQKLYGQDYYNFPMMAERNIIGLKIIIHNMRQMNFSSQEMNDFISVMKKEHFFQEIKCQSWKDIFILRLLYVNNFVTNWLLMKLV